MSLLLSIVKCLSYCIRLCSVPFVYAVFRSFMQCSVMCAMLNESVCTIFLSDTSYTILPMGSVIHVHTMCMGGPMLLRCMKTI